MYGGIAAVHGTLHIEAIETIDVIDIMDLIVGLRGGCLFVGEFGC